MATLIENKQAKRNYHFQKEFEAGIELRGYEVKSLRARQGSLKGAYVVIRGGEAWLVNAHIPAYQPKNAPDSYDPERTRRLLLKKQEIAELSGAERQPGLTVVPVAMYNKNRFIKVKIVLARGKKEYDKRQDIKRRDTERDIERTLKYNS